MEKTFIFAMQGSSVTYSDQEIKSLFTPAISSKVSLDLTQKFATFLRYTNYGRNVFLDFMRTGNDAFKLYFNETEKSNY